VSLDLIVFSCIAVGAVTTALMTILLRNPVMSAISLVANFFCIALLYLMLRAQLLAVLQIVVYTGAIMVLVIFVIMLLNLGHEERMTKQFDLRRGGAVVIGVGFAAEMLFLFFFSGEVPDLSAAALAVSPVGTVESIGTALFGSFLLPFEVTSLLLLAGIVGAVVLARRRT